MKKVQYLTTRLPYMQGDVAVLDDSTATALQTAGVVTILGDADKVTASLAPWKPNDRIPASTTPWSFMAVSPGDGKWWVYHVDVSGTDVITGAAFDAAEESRYLKAFKIEDLFDSDSVLRVYSSKVLMRKSYFRNPGNDNFREEEIIRRVVVNASGGSVDVYDEDNPASPVVSLGVGESASMTYDVAGVLMATVGGSGGGGGVVETTTYATALPGSVGPEGSQVYITGGDLDGAVYEVVGGTWQFATNYRYSARTSHPNLANVPVGFRWMLANGASSDGLYESDGSSAFQLAGFAGGGSGSGLAKLDPSWTVVNPPGTPDRTLDDGSTTTLQDINRVLGTLILDLKTILG